MIISLIAGVSKNGVIGVNHELPWRLPDDLKYFKEVTSGHAVIMGRKNYESIPEKFRPLPNRLNIILTRQSDFQAADCKIAHQVKEALTLAAGAGKEEIFIIGGAEIYREFLPMASRLYLTEINATITGDTFFPDYTKADWQLINRIHHPSDEKHQFSFDFSLYHKRNSQT
jgi:dihydrofolate reductase